MIFFDQGQSFGDILFDVFGRNFFRSFTRAAGRNRIGRSRLGRGGRRRLRGNISKKKNG